MVNVELNQQNYLKKYSSSGDDSKKKKKAKIGIVTVKIIDDDIDINSIRPVIHHLNKRGPDSDLSPPRRKHPRRREAELYNKLSKNITGAGQVPVFRDKKTGRRRDFAAEALEKREKEKRQAEIDEKYAKWGKGLKQVEDHTEKLNQDAYEMNKPMARYADDADLDAHQRNMLHAEDPMLEYVKEKQIKEGKRQLDKPTFQGSYMPNRFGIRPGCRWDGVDRSNSYEKRWFDARNSRTAVEEEAYKWSIADM